jgi:hypothetical protein
MSQATLDRTEFEVRAVEDEQQTEEAREAVQRSLDWQDR